MERRFFLKGTAAGISSAYLWIPKLAIAQIGRGDPREAIIKSRTTIADNWDLVNRGPAVQVASTGQYRPAINTALTKMQTNQYTDVSSRGTEFASSRSGLAMFGGFHVNQYDYCNHYFARNQERPLAYISTIPFMMKSFFVEIAVRRTSVSKSIELLYPIQPVEIFEAYWNQPARVPIRVECQDAIWICNYSVSGGRAGNGTFGIWPKDPNVRQAIFAQHFEWDFG